MNYILLIIPMITWGSLGIFVKSINLTSTQICLARTVIGGLFLFIIYILGKTRIDKNLVKKYLPRLMLSGAAMGFNWVLLFEAYRYTTVSVATLAYYCAPAVIFAVSPILLKEKLSANKIIGIGAAMLGMLLVNMPSGQLHSDGAKGVIFGLIAAVLYASVTLINKTIKGFTGLEVSLIQLICAAFILAPYTFITFKGTWQLPDTKSVIMLFIVCIVHTGITFAMYFTAVQKVPAQTVAICSYADPVSALVLSAVFLNEKMLPLQILGAFVIIGGAVFAEVYKGKIKV